MKTVAFLFSLVVLTSQVLAAPAPSERPSKPQRQVVTYMPYLDGVSWMKFAVGGRYRERHGNREYAGVWQDCGGGNIHVRFWLVAECNTTTSSSDYYEAVYRSVDGGCSLEGVSGWNFARSTRVP